MKAYGHSEPVYNIRYLNDCITTLRNMLTKVYSASQPNILYKNYLSSFGFILIDNVRTVSETLLTEIRKSPRKFVCVISEEEKVYYE